MLKNIKVNLNIKFLVYIFGLFTILFFIFGRLYFSQTKMRLDDKIIEEAKSIVRLSNLIFVNDITTYNDIALLDHIEKIESLENVLYAIIFYGDGTVLAHSDVYQIGTVYDDDLTKWAVSVDKFSIKENYVEGKRTYIFASPIMDKESNIIAYIRFAITLEQVDEDIIKDKKKFLIATFIFVIIFLFVFFIAFYIEIYRPLILMRDGVNLMQSRLGLFKFEILKQDEIGQLFTNINGLVGGIIKKLEGFMKQQDKILISEEKRIENIVNMLNENSDIVIADSDNKIIFYKNKLNLLKDDPINKHVMDVIQDSDIVGMIAESYSLKKKIVKLDVPVDDKKLVVTVFLFEEVAPFTNKTIIILRPYVDKK